MAKISFKDFLRQKKYLGLISGDLSQSLIQLSDWVSSQTGIEVISIETLSRFSIKLSTTEEIGYRVWFFVKETHKESKAQEKEQVIEKQSKEKEQTPQFLMANGRCQNTIDS